MLNQLHIKDCIKFLQHLPQNSIKAFKESFHESQNKRQIENTYPLIPKPFATITACTINYIRTYNYANNNFTQ